MYIAADIGGTKIAVALINQHGRIINRLKLATPKKVKAQIIYQCLIEAMDELLRVQAIAKNDIRGIGLGVPGIVDTRTNKILAAPNIDLTGYPLSMRLRQLYRVPVVIANDVNAGLMGEFTYGSARGLKHVIGIFPGTGVGGAVIEDGRLLLGYQGAATELGHMILDINGPLCHCGNHGCLESLTSRWAMERDIRQHPRKIQQQLIKKLNDGKLDQIKSRVFKQALEKKDPLTTAVVTKAARVLGKACISLNHTFNPQAIVLGGGVIKACGPWMLPIIQRELQADPFFKAFNQCQILPSQLGDDAVVLGAVALLKK